MHHDGKRYDKPIEQLYYESKLGIYCENPDFIYFNLEFFWYRYVIAEFFCVMDALLDLSVEV